MPHVPHDPDTRNDRSIGQLVAQAADDLREIISKEIALAKIEIQGSLTHVKKGAPMLAVAGVLALFALGMLLTAAAWGLHAAGLPDWLSFLLVGVFLLLVAGILALVGRKALQQVNPKPTRAIAGVEQTLGALKTAQHDGSVHASAIPASKSEAPLPHPRPAATTPAASTTSATSAASTPDRPVDA